METLFNPTENETNYTHDNPQDRANKEIDLLKQGQEWLTLDRLTENLVVMVNAGRLGEITIKEFVEKLDLIIKDAEQCLTFHS